MVYFESVNPVAGEEGAVDGGGTQIAPVPFNGSKGD